MARIAENAKPNAQAQYSRGSEGEVISASDVERFGYCPLSWWLKRQGFGEEGDELEDGSSKHGLIARDFETITQRESRAIRSQLGILWFAIIAILLGVNGAAIVYFKYISKLQTETFSFVLLIIAILWIGIATSLFLITLYRDILKRQRNEHRATADAVAVKGPAKDRVMQDRIGTEPKDLNKAISNWKTIALVFIVIAIALAFNGYMLDYPFAPPEVLSRILITSALMWLIGTSIALFFALKVEERIKQLQQNRVEIEYMKAHLKYSRSEMLMIWFAVGAIILGITGFLVQYGKDLRIMDLYGRFFLVISLLWMSTGFWFFYRALWGGVKTHTISMEIIETLDTEPRQPSRLKEHLEAIEKGKILSEEYGVLSMALLAVVLGINSIIIRAESTEAVFSRILEIVALIWLIGASIFLYDLLKHMQIANRLRFYYKLGKASIEYSDTMDEQTKLLASGRYNIRGRPDYILKRNDGVIIPVEVKTGRVPRGPHFSHILQLATYCLLVEESYKVHPPYGLIRYGDEKEFKIDYDDELSNLVISKLNEMRKCIAAGTAHRNHNRENKCRFCSRKQSCPERLD